MGLKVAGTNSYTPMYQNKKVKLPGQSRENNVGMVKIKGKGGGVGCNCKGGSVKKKGGDIGCSCKGSALKPKGVGILYKKK